MRYLLILLSIVASAPSQAAWEHEDGFGFSCRSMDGSTVVSADLPGGPMRVNYILDISYNGQKARLSTGRGLDPGRGSPSNVMFSAITDLSEGVFTFEARYIQGYAYHATIYALPATLKTDGAYRAEFQAVFTFLIDQPAFGANKVKLNCRGKFL